jgi:hypothetical protein
MKKQLKILLILGALISLQPQASVIAIEQDNFHLGETLVYQVHYGWLNAGLATMKIDSQLHTVNSQPCYRIDLEGEAKGMLYLFFKMKNKFRSYLSSSTLTPQGFYRYIQEGKYRKIERVTFDHTNKLAIVESLAEGSEQSLDTVTFPICEHIQDIVSNWYVLRTQDFSQTEVGQIFSNPIFFDDILHPNFQTKFLGRKRIKTKFGVINTVVVAPLIPFITQGPSIFAGENSVEIFLSDDKNKIPLKIKIQLVAGAVEMDLLDYQGLKHDLVFQTAKQRKK